ncbi:MAG: hypothetical protein RLZZ436_3584, partial [Planctomycetota bacterium]
MSQLTAGILLSLRRRFLRPDSQHPVRRRRSAEGRRCEQLERRLLLVGDISGQVYDDVNRNNINDPGDRDLPGWTVFIDANTDGNFNPGEVFTTTDAQGKYLITGLRAGTRRVMTIVQPGYNPPPGLTASRTVNVRDRREVKADFPMITAPVTTGQITGTIFDDPNENGVKDPTEGGISGWIVFADLNNDGLLSTGEPSTVANTDGDYVIAGVPAGIVRVQEVPVGAYRATAGGLFPLLNAREFTTVTLTAGGTARADFGNWIPQVGTIQGIVWNDINGDGLRGAGEAPLAAQAVWVDLNANGLQDPAEPVRTTDVSGNYSFVDIRTGVYSVSQVLPAGYITAEGRPAVQQTIVVRNGIHNVDFYNLQPVAGSLAGTLWNDADGNGLFTTGETPLADWTVFLDANNNSIADPEELRQQTAADGSYSFNPLAYGTKTVRVISQSNWVVTSPSVGFSSFRLLNGENRSGVNFGVRENVGTLRGFVWNDANGDGLQSPGETPLADVPVFIDHNADGILTAGEPSTISGIDGTWEFLKVPTGARTVAQVPPASWITAVGRPRTVTVTVGIGGIASVGFFNLLPATGSVSGVVFDDVNGDGLLNGADSLLDGWQIFADLNGNSVPDAGEPSSTSDTLGAYSLGGLPYGNLSIRQVPQAGFSPTTFPSNVSSFLLLNSENRSGLNFGNRDLHQFSFSGTAFHDANSNGLRDPGERGLSGITVFLDTNTNGLLDPGEPSTVTQVDYFFTPGIDETGNYSFTHLGRGNYSVRELVPPSQNATPPDARVRTLRLPALTPATIDFANRFRASEIHGLVFHDTNADGTLDDSEYRRPDVPVFLDLDRDDFCDPDEPQTISGPDGSYSFGSLPRGAYVVREKIRQPGSISVPATGGGFLWPAGTSRPASGNVTPTSLQLTLAAGQSSLQNVSLTLPGTGSLSTLVDVFLLFDDTGSFTANSPIVRAAFPTIISTLQTSLPGIDLAFGVGRFEEYGNFAAEFATGRPFILNQPIVEASRPGFSTAIQAALDRTAPGFGGDAPETDIEALYQLVTGLGFDGNNNGSTLESGPTGPASTQLNPGPSGDVPAFSSFQPDPAANVLTPAGNIGGAGFRPGALPVILTATDTGFAYQPKGETQITGLNGLSLPVASLTQLSRPTTPFNLGAGLQETVTGLNALGALVIGLGTNPLATQDPRQALESLAKLTGAVNRSLVSIPNGTPDPVDPGDPFYFQITTGFGTTVADGVTSAIQNAVTNVAMDITIRASDPRVQIVNHTGTLTGIAAGQTAAFNIEFVGDGRPSRFDLQFIRSGTSVVLGSIPVVLGTPIPGDGYHFDDLEDGDIHNSSHFGHVIANQPPVFTAGASQTALEDAGPQSVPGWAIGISAGDATETRQTLQFSVTTSNPGLFSVTPVVSPDGSLSWQSAPNAFGTAEVTVVLRDNGGTAGGGVDASVPQTFQITILPVNDTPAAAADAWDLQENTPFAVAAPGVLVNDNDADGDGLTARIVTPPAHGTLTLNADGSFLYTPTTGYYGPDNFLYVAADSTTDSAPVVVSLNVIHMNQPPIGNSDAYFGTEDLPVSAPAPGVLANDLDTDGDPLTVRLLAAPVRGLLTLQPDGSFVYLPADNDFGLLTFTYVINDGFIDSAPVTVTLDLAGINDAPVALPDRYTTAEDVILNVPVGGLTANDADPDGDVLTVVAVLQPVYGTLLLGPNGQFTYTPPLNYSGEDSFTYLVTDGLLASAPVLVTITVTPVNDPPATAADAFTLNEDTTLSIALPGLLANDSDPEGSPLTAIRVAGPARGTLIFNANGSFTWTPPANFNGTDSFTYRASDGLLTSAPTTVTLTVLPVNDSPVAADDAYTTSFNTPITVVAPGLLANDRDPDADPLTAVLAVPPANGTLILNPGGSFTWTPAVGFSGTDSFQYQASDGITLSAAATVTITVTAPVLTPKFFVVDATGLRNHQYTAEGTAITSTPLNARDTRPRGIATNPTGTIFWVIDAGGDIFVYSRDGALLGQWTPQRAGRPEGITVWGNDLWLVDPTGDRLYRFTGGAALRSGRVNATSSFALNAQNLSATDVVTDGTRFWVVDDTLATDRVFRYSIAGAFQGSWTLSPAAPTPTGITLDPNNVNHLWIVDATTDRVYQYDAGTTFISGAQTPSLSFPLAAGNGNPTGIADPRVLIEQSPTVAPAQPTQSTRPAHSDQTGSSGTPPHHPGKTLTGQPQAEYSTAGANAEYLEPRRKQANRSATANPASRTSKRSPLPQLPQP